MRSIDRSAKFAAFSLNPKTSWWSNKLLEACFHVESSPAIAGHQRAVRNVVFSPDGKALASGGEDGAIRLWDPALGKSLGEPFSGHHGIINSVAFSPDGMLLASGGDDGTIRLWDFDPEHWLARTCQIARRNFTRAEWQ
jgi:WD40 repeat protein